MSKKDEQTYVVGNLGKYGKLHEFEDTGKKVFNSSLKPIGKDTQWVNFEAWGKTGEQIKNAHENGIKKFTLQGKMVSKNYTKDGKEHTANVLRVDSVKQHLPLEIEGEIRKAEDKETSKGTPYKELFVVAEGQDKEGNKKENLYSINVWENSDVSKDVSLEVGSKAAFKGEGTILEYEKEGNTLSSTYLTAWDIAKDLPALQEQVEKKMEKKKEERLSKVNETSEKVDKAIEDIKTPTSTQTAQKQTPPKTQSKGTVPSL